MKYLTSEDSVFFSFNCYFQKLDVDTLFPKAFHNKSVYNGKYTGEALFTGHDFVTTNPGDSTATIYSSSNFLSEGVQLYEHNGFFYEPFIKNNFFPFMDDSGHLERGCTLNLLSEEKLSNITYYYIKVDREPEPFKNLEGVKPLKHEYSYWIDKNEMIPVAYAEYYVVEMNNNIMEQYEKYNLEEYEINNLTNDSVFTLQSIASFYKIKTYSPQQTVPLLPLNSVPPQWSLRSLKGEIINLSDLKGKVVLVDFFYKSCYPCMLELSKLVSLYEKYKNKGLVIIGIDPIDKQEDDLKSFLAKRSVLYDVLLGGKELAKEYHISGYPAVYILDKNGKILFALSGYSGGMENILEDVILKAL
jgi:thiol-disulfide isomerase/thioredoxin